MRFSLATWGFALLISTQLVFADDASDPLSLSPPPSSHYHLLTWANVLVPGLGRTLNGEPVTGLRDFGVSVGAFALGYSMSARSPMTLDGVPEEIPQFRGKHPFRQRSLIKPLFADWLQELGLKFDMVTTYELYRDLGAVHDPRIDATPTGELFAAPFEPKVVADPWVWVPLIASAASIVADYATNSGATRWPRLTPSSNSMYAITYTAVFPFGSAVPEEMFYRGFLQNEVRSGTGSPALAMVVSTAAYTLSHEAGTDQLAAAITGAYLSYLVERNGGKLAANIAFHFWADVLAGVEAILLAQKAQRTSPPATLGVQFNY